MKLIKYSLSIFLLMSCAPTFAKTNKISEYFQNKSGCFILYDLSKSKVIEKYNQKQCATRIAADSTFKIPLSLMAFDQNLIAKNTMFKWDGHEKGLPQWDHDQTPKTWLQYSVVWVSQELTPRIGLTKIKNYLADFKYGNQDFSGTPGKDDGLTQAWLSSSLKISADEQLTFLKRLLYQELKVSKKAIELTEKNMLLQKLVNGWKLYGKTGSGSNSHEMTEGWFIGFIEQGKQKYIFVTNFTSLNKDDMTEAGGLIAKDITIKILSTSTLLKDT